MLSSEIVTRVTNQTVGESSEASRPRADGEPEELKRGVAINRYVLLEVVGRGGMGVVYAAYDPALDRRIALKLLRSDRGGHGHERLLKEAQRQARFAHPNVVTVHDVGTFAGQVFIAMEFMSTSLRDWWSQGERTAAEIVSMFVAAGEGIAAAHALGLVHRDFKPENVLIGADGRPRVSDFGLAENEEAAVGHAVGTPAYMAPEQARRERVDARADQFSFCVALHEALYRVLPFPADRDAQRPLPLMPAAPPGSTVPASVRRVLFKGLAEDPNARYPSMTALLEALRDDPSMRRRSRWVGLGAVAALLALGSVGAWAVTRETAAERDSRLCAERVDARVESAWGAARQAKISAALGIGPTWQQVHQRLDPELVQWRAASLAACQLQAPQAERQRFSACLEERRKILQSLSDVFTSEDPRVKDNALNAVMLEVNPVSGCFRRSAVREISSVSTEADERARSALAHTRVLLTSGKYEEALEEADALARSATDASALQAKAEALLLVAELHTRLRRPNAEQPLREAIAAAEAIANDELRLRGWTAMVAWCADHRRKYVDGRFAAQFAHSILERLGRPPLPEASLLAAEGVLDAKSGNIAAAEERLERALELRLENLPNPEEHPLVAETRARLGLALPAARGLPVVLSVLETSRRLFGPSHPETALAIHNLGVVRLATRENAAALELFQQALAIREQNRAANPRADPARLGREHVYAARALRRLGQTREAWEHEAKGLDLLREGGADPEELFDELNFAITLCSELKLSCDPLVSERADLDPE
ncbi:MAG: serine/threonine protein kinase [Archangiaceae bacterium]|nr:serine/threonine protein kinase [Archangiaceae bacterium]